jgi:hypothetical protein
MVKWNLKFQKFYIKQQLRFPWLLLMKIVSFFLEKVVVQF